jgi:thiamine biosynthesis protein ThiS
MKLVLNGEPKEFAATLSIQQLLDQLNIPAGRVACEVNLKIIKRGLYPQTVLQEGDTVEIIQAIGGG